MEYQDKQEDQEQIRKAGFEKLWIWQEAFRLMMLISDICKTLPREERFRLRDQIERSSASVSANIAEGYSTYYFNDKIKSMHVAKKESGETQNHIREMQGKKYISNTKADEFVHQYERLIIGINNYIKFIIEKRENIKRKGIK